MNKTYSIIRIIFCALFLFSPKSAPADNSLQLKISFAPEYDSNALRTTSENGEPIKKDMLFRTSLLANYAFVDSERKHSLFLDYDGGGKLFFREESEDNMVNSGTAAYLYRPIDLLSFGAEGYIKDSVLRVSDRDYRLWSGAFLLNGYFWEGGKIAAQGGLRDFTYKPADEYSYKAPFTSLEVSHFFSQHIGAAVLGEISQRNYDSDAFKLVSSRYPGEILVAPFDKRNDNLYTSRVMLFYTGAVIVSGGWIYQVLNSNSIGESYHRHRLIFDLTAEPLKDVIAQIQGTLQFTSFSDSLMLSGSLFLEDDDENQTNLVVKLSRRILDQIYLDLRYALYANEFSQVRTEFFRQTISLGFSVRFGIENF